MITQKSIDEIRQIAKIEDIVKDYVSLKRRGANLLGLCPFHNEKTPSFNVNPAKNIYKCFGCGKAGDPIQFLKDLEGMGYYDALKYIANKYNIKVQEVELSSEEYSQQLEEESYYIINQETSKWFQEQLLETDYGKAIGLSYFKQRGFIEATINKFELGFSPNGGLLEHMEAKGFKMEALQTLGLITANNNEFLRERVIFPIHNLSGKIAAFAGRTLSSDKKAPKYLNSQESPIYHKSKTLYALNFAKNAIRKVDECLLVEGYTDVISMHQAGIEHVVASSGTSLTVDQVRLIKRYSPNITILYDGDSAGIKAAQRGIELILEQDCNVKIVALPIEHDPDSFVKSNGYEQTIAYIAENKKDFLLYLLENMSLDVQKDPIKRTVFVKEMAELLSKISDSIKRSVYTKEAALRLDIDERMMIMEVNKYLTKKYQDKKIIDIEIPDFEPLDPAIDHEITQSHEHQEADLLRILIQFPDKSINGIPLPQYLINQVWDIISYIENPVYKRILDAVNEMISANEILTDNFFLTHEDIEIKNLAYRFHTNQFSYSPNWKKELQTQKIPEENYVDDLIKSLKILKFRKIVSLCNENSLKIKSCIDEQELIKLLMVQQMLHENKKNLAKELNIVLYN